MHIFSIGRCEGRIINRESGAISAIATLIIAIFTITLWKSTIKQAELTQDSNNVGREAIVAEQRPWILVEAIISGPIEVTPNGLSFKFTFTLTNTGKSPALRAFINLAIVDPIETSPTKRQLLMSEHAKTAIAYWGANIFPNQKMVQTVSTSLGNDSIEAIRAKWAEKGMPLEKFMVFPCLIGCVSYHSIFNNKRVQTGFIWEIKKKSHVPGGLAITMAETPISASDLYFLQNLDDGYTD